jgi:alpha-methylacyl-CoA racemase
MQSESPGEHLLDGITVLNLGSVGPAARAARTLADYGARVLQIAPIARKSGLQTKPVYHTYGAGRDFARMRIDLKSTGGREVVLRLTETADVLIESFRPGTIDRLGLGWDVVHARCPRIIYCSTTGYGQDGPASTWAGHDLNYLAMSGFLACSEPRPDGGPPIPGATVADSAGGGMHAVVSILAALVHRGTSGEGTRLDVSAAEGALSLMALSIDQFLAEGEIADSRSVLLTGRYAFYDLYETSDGKWLSVAAIEGRFFENLCNGLGLSKYKHDQYDETKQDEIRASFRRVFKTRTRDDWTQDLAAKDTCIAPVLALPELVDDPHWRARGVFMEAEMEGRGVFRQVAPILAGGVRAHPRHQVPANDATDTADVLAGAGYASADLERLFEAGVIE